MKYDLPQDIIDKASQCKFEFSCLNPETPRRCSVESVVLGTAVFVKKNDDNFCNYNLPFGYSHICTCPVRKALHEKYGV